jgi:hypothetical protein
MQIEQMKAEKKARKQELLKMESKHKSEIEEERAEADKKLRECEKELQDQLVEAKRAHEEEIARLLE